MSKPDLIILHGALGAQSQFEKLKGLLNIKFNVHTFNFSGHGGLNTDCNYSIDLFTKDLESYLRNQGIKSTYIFGYSMGGYVALNSARANPKIKSIFTLGTKFNWTVESSKHEVKMLNPQKIEEKVPEFAKALKERHSPSDWKAVMQNTAQMMLELGRNPILTAESVSEISIPVSIGIGTLDKMVSYEESEKIAHSLPKGTLKKFDGFKHPIEQVDLDLLASSITNYFLSN